VQAPGGFLDWYVARFNAKTDLVGAKHGQGYPG
jgi:hypothetical protein